MDSWAPQRVVEASEDEPGVARLTVSGSLLFKNGTLIRSSLSGETYLIVEGKRRPLDNPSWLDSTGHTMDDAMYVSSSEINMHMEGLPLK